MSLETFIERNGVRAGTTKLKDLIAAYGETWTRARMVAELTRLGFQVGEVHGVACIAPLTLHATYAVRDGHLVTV